MHPDATSDGTPDSSRDGRGDQRDEANERCDETAERRDGADERRDENGGERRGEDSSTTGDAEESSDAVTRRTFLRTTGATVAAAGASIAGSDEVEAQAQTYRFGGEVAAWRGREPSEIQGSSNPTIQLRAGTEYEFWFENLDGQPHNMTIQDDGGGTVVQSDLISNQGATASVTFTATSAMSTYVCTVHPNTMVGDLEVAGQAEGGEGGGTEIGFGTAVFVAALVLAFLSPLLFALFLFSRRGGGGGETPAG